MEAQTAYKVGSHLFNENVARFDRFHLISSLFCIPIRSRVIEWSEMETCGFHGLVVRTLDSESSNPSSSLGGTSKCFEGWIPFA